MKYIEINPLKLKVFFEFNYSEEKEDLIDQNFLPEVSKISDKEIYFNESLKLENIHLIRKIVILIFTLGKWKEYEVHPNKTCLVEENENPTKSFNLLQFVIDEREQISLRQDMRLI